MQSEGHLNRLPQHFKSVDRARRQRVWFLDVLMDQASCTLNGLHVRADVEELLLGQWGVEPVLNEVFRFVH